MILLHSEIFFWGSFKPYFLLHVCTTTVPCHPISRRSIGANAPSMQTHPLTPKQGRPTVQPYQKRPPCESIARSNAVLVCVCLSLPKPSLCLSLHTSCLVVAEAEGININIRETASSSEKNVPTGQPHRRRKQCVCVWGWLA